MKKPYIPRGCDQQGRYPEAAEAATDLGVEEPEHDMLGVVIQDTLRALACVIIAAVLVLLAVVAAK